MKVFEWAGRLQSRPKSRLGGQASATPTHMMSRACVRARACAEPEEGGETAFPSASAWLHPDMGEATQVGGRKGEMRLLRCHNDP
jgi:hypothetical protein